MQQYSGWHKASYSAGQDNCVEQGVASTGTAAVRDTKDKGQGPILEFSPEAWTAFLADVASSDRLTGGYHV